MHVELLWWSQPFFKMHYSKFELRFWFVTHFHSEVKLTGLYVLKYINTQETIIHKNITNNCVYICSYNNISISLDTDKHKINNKIQLVYRSFTSSHLPLLYKCIAQLFSTQWHTDKVICVNNKRLPVKLSPIEWNNVKCTCR